MNKREFKFRVWVEDEKAWGNPVCLEVFNMSNKLEYLYGKDREYTIQQWTGLKDKNGVEIYEGDIIRGMMEFGPAGFHERSVIVKWDNKEGYQWNYFLLDTIKVEGNMFENPELLDLI